MLQMPRLVSLLLMATLIGVLGLTFYSVLAPFLMPLFLAGVLAILFQPVFQRILGWTRRRTRLAAALTTTLILALLLVPVSMGTASAARQLYRFGKSALTDPDWRKAMNAVTRNAAVQRLVQHYGELTGEVMHPDELEQEVDLRLREAAELLARKTLGFAGSTLSLLAWAVSLLVSTLTFAIALYYFFADGPALIEGTINLIPVHRDYQRQLIVQFDQAVRAVVSATFAAAIGQGIACGVGMYFAGYTHFFLATILATLTALVPLLGTWLIWGPYAAWLAYNDHWVGAIALAVYGLVFIGLLDNVIRAYVLHSNAKLHPLLAFVSVLGGLQTMGLWGVFVGPIVASCLHALIKIFNTELIAFSLQRQAGSVRVAGAETAAVAATQPVPSIVQSAEKQGIDGDGAGCAAGTMTGAAKPQASAGGTATVAGPSDAAAKT